MGDNNEQRSGIDRRAIPEVCELQHKELDRRMTTVEVILQTEFKNMYSKIESQTLLWAERAAESAKRPGWATLVLVTALSSACVGLLVASAFR